MGLKGKGQATRIGGRAAASQTRTVAQALMLRFLGGSCRGQENCSK